MLSDSDKQILSRLKNEDPEAYDFFERREAEHKELLKKGCHDLRNIVTLLSGSYQLLKITKPQFNNIPRFVTMGSDIKSLVKAFNDIALFRYAAAISPCEVRISDFKLMLDDYISNNYSDFFSKIDILYSPDDVYVYIDTSRLINAVGCLISNAIEASDFSTPITIIISSINDYNISISVQNHGECPSPDIADTILLPFCTDKQEHLGLGLAIASETADAMNGKLYWNHADGFTCFTITTGLTKI